MWTYIPYIYSRVREEESLPTCSSDIELLAQSKSKHIPEKFCSPGSLTDAYLDSLFGTTCEHSEVITQTLLAMSNDCGESSIVSVSREDSPAKILVPQAKVPGSKVKKVGFGKNSRGSLVRLDRSTSSWKIRLCSPVGDWEPFSQTWPNSGTMQSGSCWEQMTWEPRIEGSDSGFWSTPRTNMGTGPGKRGEGDPNLQTAVQMWPTPTANEDAAGTPKGEMQPMLGNHPLIRGTTPEEWKLGTLNPPWVEWLMGWPIEWTSLEPLETARFRSAPLLHGKYYPQGWIDSMRHSLETLFPTWTKRKE